MFNRSKNAKALEQFVKSNWINGLTNEKALKNIEEGLVEIIYPCGSHKANGLLITEDGYLLSCQHCLGDGINNSKIKTSDGKIYTLEKICIEDEANDLVLAKADINNKPFSKQYRFHNTNIIEKIPIQLITRWDGNFIQKYGLIIRNWNPYEDINGRNYRENICTNGISIKGDSGGVIVSPSYEIVGFQQGGNKEISSVVKLDKALDLICRHVSYLKSANSFFKI